MGAQGSEDGREYEDEPDNASDSEEGRSEKRKGCTTVFESE